VVLLEAAGDLEDIMTALANLGENRRLVGALTEALRANDQAFALAIRVASVRYETFLHLNVAQILATTGEWEESRIHMARAEELAARQDVAAWIAPLLLLHRGVLALREGNWHAAHELLQRATELGAVANAECAEYAQAALAELALQEGRAEEARDSLQELVKETEANLPLLLPLFAWAQLELGETERGLELAKQAERETRARQTLLYLPETQRIEGMALTRLGRTKEARKVLMEGRERAAAMPDPYTEARILEALGLLDRQQRKADQAREQLQEALTIFQRLGASKDVERTEQTLTERAGG
jgi:tetratricopeptide (TPR) repeat protein